MALPTILVNSATGSDSAASGAGPATALTGTAASVAGTATSVSITDAVDLSGVAVDGSAVLYYQDGTAGHRNFDNITAISGSSGAWTVTVANGFSTSTGPFSWAIGGKRASIGGAVSAKLIENNGAAGDAMPGWTIRMQSGHSETIAATKTFRRSGDESTNGPITLDGEPGFTTRPLLTFSNNGNAFAMAAGILHWVFRGFEMQNSNATKTASVALSLSVTGGPTVLVSDVKIYDSTNKFWKGISIGAGANTIEGCEVANCASDGITNSGTLTIRDSAVHHNGGHGIVDSINATVRGCKVYANTGDGYRRTASGAASLPEIVGNVFDGNGSDGVEITATSAQANSMRFMLIQNNIFSNNTGAGLNFSGASFSDAIFTQTKGAIRNNDFYNNGSKYAGITVASSIDEQTLDPQYTAAASGNFEIGTNLKALGYPTHNVGNSSATRSYVDIGVAQRQEPAGAAGGATIIGQSGGIIRGLAT